jgi:predicted DNA-binding transcriptional regulator
MSKDQIYGAIICLASVVGLVAYTVLLYLYPVVVLQITAFIAVALVLVIMGWIGYTMATTPPPAPLEIEPPTPETPETAAKDTM